MQHFDARDKIKALDVGTGPGFFACILSEEGLEVTAIDQSEGMLEVARENAKKLGVSPSFLRMNVNQLDFPDESFDLVVSRNVTWTLQYPDKVYASLKRVLKSGGMLLIYDANWYAHLYDPELMKKVRAREEAHFRKYRGRPGIPGHLPDDPISETGVGRRGAHGAGLQGRDPAGHRQVRVRRLGKRTVRRIAAV